MTHQMPMTKQTTVKRETPMTNQTRELLSLNVIKFEVDDLDESIRFYRNLGCFIDDATGSSHIVLVDISFNLRQDVMIRLRKDFSRSKKLTDAEKLPVFELFANEQEGNFHDDVVVRLSQNGIQYTDALDLNVYMPIQATFLDPSNNKWEVCERIESMDFSND